jgi:hypothetical protein
MWPLSGGIPYSASPVGGRSLNSIGFTYIENWKKTIFISRIEPFISDPPALSIRSISKVVDFIPQI